MSSRWQLLVATLALSCAAAGTAAVGTAGTRTASSSFTVGYVAYSLTSPIQQDMVKGMKQEAKKYGYTLKTADSQGSVATADSLMLTYVRLKVNAIIVDSYAADTLATALAAAVSAKIPVYFAWEWAKPKKVAYSITLTGSAQQTNRMVKDLGGKGAVLAFTLPAGDNCTHYSHIMEAIMKKHPKIQLTEHASPPTGWAPDAAAATAAWLRSHPAGTPLAIWGCFDGPNIGAVSALQAANRTDVKVYGDNGANDAIALIIKKQYTATWWFDSIALGKTLVDAAHKNANIPYSAIKPVFAFAPPILVDQSNVKAFVKKYPRALKG